MSRIKRINLPHCLYYVASRALIEDLAFHGSADHRIFLKYLAKYIPLFDFRLHAFCFTDHQFHLLLESGPGAGLSELMRRLLTAYTVCFNRYHLRHGRLFHGPFRSIIVDKDEHLVTLSRHIHRKSPTALGPGDETPPTASSFAHYARGSEPDWLTTRETLRHFDGNRERYARFVLRGADRGGIPEILDLRYLGSEAFAKRVKLRIDGQGKAPVVPGSGEHNGIIRERERREADRLIAMVYHRLKLPSGPVAKNLRLDRKGSLAMKLSILQLIENMPWTYRQIAQYLGLTNENAVKYHVRAAMENPEVQSLFSELCGGIN